MSQIIRFPHYQFQVIQFRPRKQIHLHPREGVFSHSVYVHGRCIFAIQFRPTETAPKEESLASTDRSQMNCASISNTADSSDFSPKHVVGSNYHSLSITDLPLTQEKVETTYADVFQGSW